DHGRAQGFTSGRFLFPNEEAEGGEADLQSLLDFADRIRVGMAGNLQTYEYENRFGEVVTGGNERIGYTLQPYETVNYIDKHDNETLWDNTQAKLPFDMEMEHRVDIHILSNALINYGQGVPFYQLGSDFLRSKSMDRNSFDSTDWFNTVDLSMQSHNWAIGLPPGWDNRDRWDEMRELMTLESINVEPKHMERSAEAFQHQLRIRYSSPLFRLRTGEDVRQRVAFHNTGPDQQPGILAMSITDDACAGDPLDPDRDGLLVLANAHNQTQQFTLPGTGYRLHPLETDRDNFHIQATDDQSTLFTLPAHRAVVFELPAGSSTTLACNPHFSTLQEPGAVIYFQAPEHWGSDIRAVPQPEGDEGLTISYTMQALDDHWFRMQLPDGMKQASIWFSDVSGNEAGPHHYPGSGCYTPDSEGWKPTVQCELPTFTVAFHKPDGWAETIHVYTFGPEQNGSWPGEPMARHGDGWYTAEYSAAQVSSGIIFNDASGNQTSDLFRDKAGCYENSRWVDSCTVLQQ
ncbi:MAG: alpha-1,6-glucosidase domain-containing protein, partial [Balneolaceae bacterium]